MEAIDRPTLRKHTPFAQYEEVSVLFADAYTDTEIPHSLLPPTPEHINYEVIAQAQAGQIFHDMSFDRVPWREGVIRLQSSVTNARVKLRLSVSHKRSDLIENAPGTVTAPVVAHTHVKADITDFAHTHVKADVTDFAHTHDAADVTTGTLLDARLSSNVPLKNATNVFTGANEFQSSFNLSGYRMKFVLPGVDTLSTAVTAMTEGDALILGAGTYTQTVAVTIPNGITKFAIIGQGSGVTILNYTNNTYGIRSDLGTNDAYRIQNATIRGFSLVYSSATPGTGYGIALWGRDYNSTDHPSIHIDDVSMHYGASSACWTIGFFILNSKNLKITNSFFRGSPSSRLHMGIYLESCMNVRIENCFLMSTLYGIVQVKASDALISGVTKHGCEDVHIINTTIFITSSGIFLGEKATWSKISNVEISRPVNFGIYEDPSALGMHQIDHVWMDNDSDMVASANFIQLEEPGTIVRGCVFEDTALIGVNGITCTGSATLCTIADNLFRTFGTGGHSGIYFNAANNKATGNVFAGSIAAGADITIAAAATGCLAANNMIDDAIVDASGVAVLANNPVH